MNCPFCGTPNPAGYQECEYCGLEPGREWVCPLCRSGNSGQATSCGRCDLPRGRGGSWPPDLPAGWERAQIVTDEFAPAEDGQVWARLMVKVTTHAGERYAERTAAFKRQGYDENGPPEPMSAEAFQASQELRERLRTAGWQPAIFSDQTPQPFLFWRKMPPMG